MPSIVRGNIRSEKSCFITVVEAILPQYFSGTGLSHIAFSYVFKVLVIHVWPDSSFHYSVLPPGYGI
jgi:hypothetical protein